MPVIAEQAVMSPLEEFGLLVGPEVGLHLEKMFQCGLLKSALCLTESSKGRGDGGGLARGGLHGGGEFQSGCLDFRAVLLALFFVGLLERVQNRVLLGGDFKMLMHPEMQSEFRLFVVCRGQTVPPPRGAGGNEQCGCTPQGNHGTPFHRRKNGGAERLGP